MIGHSATYTYSYCIYVGFSRDKASRAPTTKSRNPAMHTFSAARLRRGGFACGVASGSAALSTAAPSPPPPPPATAALSLRRRRARRRRARRRRRLHRRRCPRRRRRHRRRLHPGFADLKKKRDNPREGWEYADLRYARVHSLLLFRRKHIFTRLCASSTSTP